MSSRTVLVLGSTVSIGTQSLDIVARNRDLFRVVGVAAFGSDVTTLAEQVVTLDVPAVAGSGRTA